MGTWGPGNFENDDAAGHLIEFCAPLLKQIEEILQDPSLFEPDESESSIILANLEIIACLSEHLGRYTRGGVADMLYPCVLPAPAVIKAWKARYLSIWNDGIDGLDPESDYENKRREVITETFDRVERLARSRSEG